MADYSSSSAEVRRCMVVHRRTSTRGATRGLTLVELMVAIAIGLFMVAVLVTLYVKSSAARIELDRSSRQIENGRFAMEILREDIALAGYYGELSTSEVVSFVAVNPCASTLADMGWSNATESTAPPPVQGPPSGSTDLTFAGCTKASLNQLDGTGFLVVRRVSPDAIAASAVASTAFYLQSNRCLGGATPFAFNKGPAINFGLLGVDCATTAQVRQYESKLYYVSSCGVCSPNDGVPTLKTRELVGDQIVERVVADGIEDLQFEFGLDTDDDGFVESYAKDGTATDWPNVVAIRIHLISRGDTPSPEYLDDKSYDRGALFGAYSVPSDGTQYKRRSYTALALLPNRSGPREAP